MKQLFFFLLLCLCATLAWPGAGPSTQALVMLYNRHAAYHEATPSGEEQGLLAAPVTETLQKAQIDFRWREVPVARQRMILEGNLEPACVVAP